MRRRDLMIGLGATTVLPAWPVEAESPFTEDAGWELAGELIDHMGGAALWSQVGAVRIEERAQAREDDAPLTVNFVRDLTRPRIRIDAPARPAEDIVVLSDAGWSRQNGVITLHPADRSARFVRGWGGNIYVLYRRLARRDPALRVTRTDARAFEVAEDGVRMGWFELARDGGLVRWRRYGVMDPSRVFEEWVYGLSRPYGPARLPGSGATIDGSLRFEYRAFELDPSPAPESIFEPPV